MVVMAPPGFRFQPTDEELISYYLLPKFLGQTLLYDFMKKQDLYGHNCTPWELFDVNDDDSWIQDKPTEKSVYVFTTLSKLRTCESNDVRSRENTSKRAGCGTWVGSTKNLIRDGDGKLIGEKRLFVFKINEIGVQFDLSKACYFKMHEYCLSGINKDLDPADGCDVVLCKITFDSSKESIFKLGSKNNVHVSESSTGEGQNLKKESGPVYKDRKRMISGAKKTGRGGVELATWNSKLDSMSECEMMKKNKRRKTVIDDSRIACSQTAQQLWSNNNDDLCLNYSTIADQVESEMNPIEAVDSLDQAIVKDRMEEAMNLIGDGVGCSFDLSSKADMMNSMIKDNDGCNFDVNPIAAMNLLDQAIVMDPIKEAMNSFEDSDIGNLDMNPMSVVNSLDQAIVMDPIKEAMNSIEDNDSHNPQPIAMTKPDDVNEMTPPMFDDNTFMDLQQQFLYDPSNPFVNYNSGGLCLWKFSNAKVCSRAIIRLSVTASFYALMLFD